MCTYVINELSAYSLHNCLTTTPHSPSTPWNYQQHRGVSIGAWLRWSGEPHIYRPYKV